MSDEYKGMWPGGWREDSHGNLAFTIRGPGRDEDAEPVWACQLCRRGQLHTLAEHNQIIGLAAKR